MSEFKKKLDWLLNLDKSKLLPEQLVMLKTLSDMNDRLRELDVDRQYHEALAKKSKKEFINHKDIMMGYMFAMNLRLKNAKKDD